MSDTPEILWQRVRQGDGTAAEQLIAIFFPKIYGWLRRLTGDEADAADLTQKTFIRVWGATAKFEGRSSFATWLHGIGHHVYVDWRRQKRPGISCSDSWWHGSICPAALPGDALIQRELAEMLYALVETLGEEVRQTVHLHYYEGLSIADTSEVLGVATSTVKYRLRQAIDRLRPQFAETDSHSNTLL